METDDTRFGETLWTTSHQFISATEGIMPMRALPIIDDISNNRS